jgi:RHS repeat-associated protein
MLNVLPVFDRLRRLWMAHKHKKAALTGAAFLLLAPCIVWASQVTVTVTGTVSSGTDTDGFFVAPGGSLAGYGFTATYTYNDALGTTTTSAPSVIQSSGNSNPVVNASLTINGVTYTFDAWPPDSSSSYTERDITNEGSYYDDQLTFSTDWNYMGLGDQRGSSDLDIDVVHEESTPDNWVWENALSITVTGSDTYDATFSLEHSFYINPNYYGPIEVAGVLTPQTVTVSGPVTWPSSTPSAASTYTNKNLGNCQCVALNDGGTAGPIAAASSPAAVASYSSSASGGSLASPDLAAGLAIDPPISIGEPVNVGTGNVTVAETDFQGPPSTHLAFTRYYNSFSSANVGLGVGWTSTWHRGLAATTSTETTVTRADGRQDVFTLSGSSWVSDSDVTSVLSEVTSGGSQVGWKLVLPDDSTEKYNMSGQLTSVTNRAGLTTSLSYTSSNLTSVTGPFGQALNFTYTGNELATMKLPDGSSTYNYGYDTNNNLAYAENPDGYYRTYSYGLNPDVDLLTGIADEDGNQFATWTYDSTGRALTSQHGGGADKISLSYTTTSVTVTDANSNALTYTTTTQNNLVKLSSLSGSNFLSAGGKSYTYDANGFVASVTDWDGNVTDYTNNSSGEITSMTEAYGTGLARTTTITWSGTYHEPVEVQSLLDTTSYTYDSSGDMLTRSVYDGTTTRTWTYTYNSSGQPLTIKDPLSNTTTLAYTTSGYVSTITNPLSQTTSFTSYDGNGRLLSMTDPNSVTTSYTWNKEGKALTKTTGSNEITWTEDQGVGKPSKVEFADSSYFTYTYDSAHRLTQVTDAAGNYISYGYDPASNLTSVKVYNSTPTLEKSHTYTYDSSERLLTDSGAAAGETTTYGHDAQGNLAYVTDPLSHTTTYAYDALNRVTTTTDANSHATVLSYNTNNDVLTVKDPLGNTTTYAYDGFHDVTSLKSPDTGTTTNTYDKDGNLLTSKDALGNTTTYTYDGLNRALSATYSGGTSISYGYDAGSYGIGHLTHATDLAGTTTYTYDEYGHTLSKKQTTGSVALTVTYDYYEGRLYYVTYPSGKTVYYYYDGEGRVDGISTGIDANNVTYFPFGMASGWSEDNGTTYARGFDSDGRLTSITLDSTTTNVQSLGYNDASLLTTVTETGLSNKTYAYDALNRTTTFTNGSATTVYAYDNNGNRTSYTTSAGTVTYHYTSGTNQLSSLTGTTTATYTTDSDGHITGDGTNTWTYGTNGRLKSATVGGVTTSYGINFLGQRITKSGTGVPNGGTNEYMYDEAGHLIGEYGSTGSIVNETVWLPNTPVAMLSENSFFGERGVATPVAVLTTTGGATEYSVSAGWENEPHIIANSSKSYAWTWDRQDFGNNSPNQNPSGLGTFTYNPRFPGQYYDSETGINQNWNRDYNPVLSRYIESDPMGLWGGSWSTYGYAGDNPLSYIDRLGLSQWTVIIGFGPGGIITWGYNSGQFNVGAFLGAGGGATPISVTYDPNDSGLHPTGGVLGVMGATEVGFGRTNFSAAAFSQFSNANSCPVSFGQVSVNLWPTPLSYTPVNIENGQWLPPLSLPTIGGGETSAAGGGGIYYFPP